MPRNNRSHWGRTRAVRKVAQPVAVDHAVAPGTVFSSALGFMIVGRTAGPSVSLGTRTHAV